MNSTREPFAGRYYGIVNVEGEGGFVALYPSRKDADAEVARRRALDPEDDNHLTEYHQVFPADIMGAWWNSHDADPRERDPLNLIEICREHMLPGESVTIDRRKPSGGAA